MCLSKGGARGVDRGSWEGWVDSERGVRRARQYSLDRTIAMYFYVNVVGVVGCVAIVTRGQLITLYS